MTARTAFRSIALVVAVVLPATLPPPFGTRIGATNFRDLWTAAYLLGHHANLVYSTFVLETQNTLTLMSGSRFHSWRC